MIASTASLATTLQLGTRGPSLAPEGITSSGSKKLGSIKSKYIRIIACTHSLNFRRHRTAWKAEARLILRKDILTPLVDFKAPLIQAMERKYTHPLSLFPLSFFILANTHPVATMATAT